MKQVVELINGWKLKRIDSRDAIDPRNLDAILAEGSLPEDRVFDVGRMPQMIYEILIDHGMMENPCLNGDSSDCLWVSRCDWLYACDFRLDKTDRAADLRLEGLDTFVDVYLNGRLIGSGEDVYLPLRLDVTGMLKENNRLILHFHSPEKKLDAIPLAEELEGKVVRAAKARVLAASFSDYLGPKPSLPRYGVYDRIAVEITDQCEIACLDCVPRVSAGLEEATLEVRMETRGTAAGCTARFELLDPDGVLIDSAEREMGTEEPAAVFTVGEPRLWWPRTHGESPLYTVRACIQSDRGALDCAQKRVGFRRLTLAGDFDFRINNKPLKLWGANLAPADTLTNVYNREKMNALLDLCEMAHFNCVRVWGESERLDDDFYDQCDERGILIWQDFFASYTMYPADRKLYELIRREAEYQVGRLKHRPSILLWCGGNESIMSRDADHPGEEFSGLEIFSEVLPSVCAKLDLDRYYHRSCPDGGAYANDPLAGDTHGYTHLWHVPGNCYPVFLSENCRVSTPALRTMKRMMKPDDLWPEGYDGLQHKNSDLVWPEAWEKYNSNQGVLKLGNVEDYYDATDLGAMLYRIGWGHGEYIRSRVERYRRGRSAESAETGRITKGHLLWKLNNSSNHLFFGVVDYFQEPYIPYYSMRRAYSPVLLSFDKGNFIRLWMVNDTVEEISGRVYVRLFNPIANRVEKEFDLPFAVRPDESALLCDLNRFGQFRRSNILWAYAVSADGKRVAESVDYADIERHLRFPADAKVRMELADGELILSSDKYARSVELIGDEDGDEFGWLFEDNYFDLIPGQFKKVRVFGRHQKGRISAKPYYSEYTTIIDYKK